MVFVNLSKSFSLIKKFASVNNSVMIGNNSLIDVPELSLYGKKEGLINSLCLLTVITLFSIIVFTPIAFKYLIVVMVSSQIEGLIIFPQLFSKLRIIKAR